MRISQLGRAIHDSPTLRLNERARLLKERGEPVIHLGIGEPKNKTPLPAILSSAAMLKAAEVKYTPTDGTPSLKKAIVRYMEENYGRAVAPENIVVSTGAKQSLHNILFSIVDPQDEVIILAPYWVSYPEMVRMMHGIPVIVTPQDGTFHPRMEDILPAVSSYTRAIIVNSPNNPSGAVFSADLIRDLVVMCEERGIYLIMDDIYHKLVFDGIKTPTPYAFTNKHSEESHVIVVNGISKLYGMTGFRIGWSVAPRRLSEVMTNVQSQTTSCPSALLQAAAEGALTGQQSAVEALRLTIQNNRDITMQYLSTIRGVHAARPQGTFYVLPDMRAYSKDSVALSNFLLEKALVVTVPGKEFGMEGHIRLSFSGGPKEMIEAVERIKWAIDPESPSEIFIGDRKLVRNWL